MIYSPIFRDVVIEWTSKDWAQGHLGPSGRPEWNTAPLTPCFILQADCLWICSIKTSLPLFSHLKHKISDMWEIGGKIWLSSSHISKSRNCPKSVLSPSQEHSQYRCFSLCDWFAGLRYEGRVLQDEQTVLHVAYYNSHYVTTYLWLQNMDKLDVFICRYIFLINKHTREIPFKFQTKQQSLG